MNEPHTAELGSAADIARLINRSRPGVQKAISRLGIEPVHSISRIPVYFLDDAVAQLRKSMRAANRTNTNSGEPTDV